MFKKDVSISTKSKLKTSQQRALREKFGAQYPLLKSSLDEALGPKNEQWEQVKLRVKGEENKELDKVETHVIPLYVLPKSKTNPHSIPLFYETKDSLIPHLKLVHRFPTAFPLVRIDRGAIRFVLSGAKLAVPGLTSPGGRLPDAGNDGEDERYGSKDLQPGEIVVVEAEGKEEACMVGTLLMGTGKMKEEKKGYAMEDGHYLGDHLWSLALD